jgi:pimeloyl-ACP methyl ester carboxylesterase
MKTVQLENLGPVEVTIDRYGEGQPFLLLHGGGGPDTVSRFAAAFADAHPVQVLVPIHPGFGMTPRPERLHTIKQLAVLYVALLADLDLSGVTVMGNSVGGWIAAEMALLHSARISGMILIDSVGILVEAQRIADFFSLTPEQVLQAAFHNPDRFRVDPTSMPEAAQQTAAANRVSLATYAGTAMSDATLETRLEAVNLPSLVLWGDSDHIVTPEYGRALARAIPGAHFQILAEAGHLPQVESPVDTMRAIWNWAKPDLTGGGRRVST